MNQMDRERHRQGAVSRAWVVAATIQSARLPFEQHFFHFFSLTDRELAADRGGMGVSVHEVLGEDDHLPPTIPPDVSTVDSHSLNH